MSIHAIDIVQPPGIGIPRIADIDPHQTIVTAVLAAKKSDETPKKIRSEIIGREVSRLRLGHRRAAGCFRVLVLVVAAPPDARLVPALRGAVEPLEHAPEAVDPARIRGIRVIDDAVLEHERAQARPLARVRTDVGSGRRRQLSDRSFAGFRQDRKSTRLNSSHSQISYAVFCLKKKKMKQHTSLTTRPYALR